MGHGQGALAFGRKNLFRRDSELDRFKWQWTGQKFKWQWFIQIQVTVDWTDSSDTGWYIQVTVDWTDSRDSALEDSKEQCIGQVQVTVDDIFKWQWIGQIQVTLDDIFKWQWIGQIQGTVHWTDSRDSGLDRFKGQCIGQIQRNSALDRFKWQGIGQIKVTVGWAGSSDNLLDRFKRKVLFKFVKWLAHQRFISCLTENAVCSHL